MEGLGAIMAQLCELRQFFWRNSATSPAFDYIILDKKGILGPTHLAALKMFNLTLKE
jgi:hypothetical protein